MNNILLEIVIVFCLLLANGVFAMAEISVVSSRKGRLQKLSDEGSPAAAKALALAQEPSRFLSTVQIGITLVGILAGAFGGATISEKWRRGWREFRRWSLIARPSASLLRWLRTRLSRWTTHSRRRNQRITHFGRMPEVAAMVCKVMAASPSRARGISNDRDDGFHA